MGILLYIVAWGTMGKLIYFMEHSGMGGLVYTVLFLM